MPKLAKKRSPGEFAPTQFATCLENGLNIHAQATTTAAASSKTDKKKQKEVSKSKGKKHNFVDNPAAKGAAATTIKSNQIYPRIECTNGAMEALQLCHSEFIKATSTALVALESSTNNKNTTEQGAAAAASSSKKKVSFSSTTKTVTYNENHVVECMKQMGFSNLVERAMESLNAGSSSKQQHNNNKVKQQKQQQQQQPSNQPPPNKKRKRKSNPLDDAALLAEQERLLSESARRVYHNHNQQQQTQQQQQLQLQQKKDGKSHVTNTSIDLGSNSRDASVELV